MIVDFEFRYIGDFDFWGQTGYFSTFGFDSDCNVF